MMAFSRRSLMAMALVMVVLLSGCALMSTQGESSEEGASVPHKAFAKRLYEGWVSGDTMPQLCNEYPNADLADGYAVQKEFVQLMREDYGIGGYKAAVVGASAQEDLGIDMPITGVLPGSGIYEADEDVTINLDAYPGRMVETEIGYRFDSAISEPVGNVDQLQKRVAAVFAVIEVPGGDTEEAHSPTAADLAAWNGSAKAIITGPEHDASEVDPDDVDIALKHNGDVISEAHGDEAAGGQYATLLKTVNHLVSQGYTIKPDHPITNGALGGIITMETGTYRADFGQLGTIEFEGVRED